MTQRLLSLSLLNLALQSIQLASAVDESFFQLPNTLTKEDTVTQGFEAFLETLHRERNDWSEEYAQALAARWEGTFKSTAFRAAVVRMPPLSDLAQQIEIFFLDHLYPWASPRGQAPQAISGAHHQAATLRHAKRMFGLDYYDVARRLLDWPSGADMFLKKALSAPKPWWLSGLDLYRGLMQWCSAAQHLSAPALQVLMDHGLRMPTYEQDIPVLAAADNNATVALIARHTEDVLAPERPFSRRSRDLRLILQGWKSPIEEHLLRTGQDGRRDFSGAARYLTEKLRAWPQVEVETALLPWISTQWLNDSVNKGTMQPGMAHWVTALMSPQTPFDPSQHPVVEKEHTWTFEQWCAVRFLRGHGQAPTVNNLSLSTRFAQRFSAEQPNQDAESLQRTADLYRLIRWVDPQQPKEQTPVEYVPLDRLIPLLMDIMEGDGEPPEKHRDRLHHIMLSVFDSPLAQHAPEMAPLVVAYTQWAWQESKRSTDLANVGVLEWLTHPAHADLLTPGDAHFVAVNMMTSSIPFRQPLAQAAWEFLGRSIEHQGHLQDQRTQTLASPFEASGQLRATSDYQSIVRAAGLEQGLPEAAPRKPKMRF